MSDCYEEVRVSDKFRFKLYQDEDSNTPEDWDNEDVYLRIDEDHLRNGLGRCWDISMFNDAVQHPEEFHTFPVFRGESPQERVFLSFVGGFLEQGSDTRQGYVYVRKNVWNCLEDALKAAQAHLDEWNMYLNGDVWGFEILEDTTCKCCGNTTTEVVDSLWGIYGFDYARNQARDACTTYT